MFDELVDDISDQSGVDEVYIIISQPIFVTQPNVY
jgi:hypothetical protein